MSYPNLPKSEYFQVFLAFRSCKASALLRPQHKKSNENLSLYRSKIFYRTDFWSIKAKTERILHGFASILTTSERKSVYKKHGSDNSFHPKLKRIKNEYLKNVVITIIFIISFLHYNLIKCVATGDQRSAPTILETNCTLFN